MEPFLVSLLAICAVFIVRIDAQVCTPKPLFSTCSTNADCVLLTFGSSTYKSACNISTNSCGCIAPGLCCSRTFSCCDGRSCPSSGRCRSAPFTFTVLNVLPTPTTPTTTKPSTTSTTIKPTTTSSTIKPTTTSTTTPTTTSTTTKTTTTSTTIEPTTTSTTRPTTTSTTIKPTTTSKSPTTSTKTKTTSATTKRTTTSCSNVTRRYTRCLTNADCKGCSGPFTYLPACNKGYCVCQRGGFGICSSRVPCCDGSVCPPNGYCRPALPNGICATTSTPSKTCQVGNCIADPRAVAAFGATNAGFCQ